MGNRQAQNEAAQREFGMELTAVEEAAKLWQEALGATQERAKTGNKNTVRQDGVRDRYDTKGKSFTEDKYFARQMDRWDELADGSRIKVGTIREGSALKRVGLPTAGMYFDVGKIRKAMGKHADHLLPGILKGIPDLLNDPIVITEYRGPKGDIDNTVNVYGNFFLPNSNTPIVVGVVMRHGGNLASMPQMDTFYAHDMLFVLENYDETSFGVIEAIDPAKHQEKANLVLEVMKDGNIEYPSEYRRRIENLRRWKRRNAGDSMFAGNTRTGAEDAGTSSQYGTTRNRGAVAKESSGVDNSKLRFVRETEIKRNLHPEKVEYTKNIELLQEMEALQAVYRRDLEAEELGEAFLRGFNAEE